MPNDVLPPRNSSTVAFASDVPVNVGVVSFVSLSVLEFPLSVPAVMSGVDGAPGAFVSITSALFALSELAAPGLASVNSASFPVASWMVPPFSASEFVAT